jgi:hypothetical protein
MSDVTQDERRAWLIAWLLAERPEYADMQVPEDEEGQRQLLRALMNVRAPLPVTDEFLAVQDAYLAERLSERGVTALDSLAPVGDEGVDAQLYLWRGDITTLAVDGIVNAANSLSNSVAPLYYSAIYDATGSYNIALITGIVLVGVSLLLLCVIKPISRPENNEQ